MISRKTVQEVFDAARIEEVVGDFLNLKRRGSNMVGLCPFHDEKTPSFNVSPSRNIYKCFGCGRGGDPVNFIMEHERYSFPEAIRFLAGRYNIPIEETVKTDVEEEEHQEAESLRLINAFANQFFVKSLHETEEGRAVGLSYFKERGFLEKTIRKFELGYAPESGDALKKAALKEGYTEERLSTLGLLNRAGKDMYRSRVVFPIHNLSGKIIAFGARALRSGPKEPKYINSPENPIYSKRKVLYGMHIAKNAIRKTEMCYLVEGYTDVISLVQAGIENVVSSSGTALTVEQISMIRRFTQNITVLYDGDPAGVKAALRGLDLLLEENMHVRLVMLPAEDDPDSLVRKLGRDAFLEYLERETKDFILFKTSLLSEESKHDPVKRSITIREIVQSIALIPDPIKRASYLKECSQMLEMDEQMLIQETAKSIQANLKKKQTGRPREDVNRDFSQLDAIVGDDGPSHRISRSEVANADYYQERNIVRLMIQSGSELVDQDSGVTVAQYIIENIQDVVDTFDHPIFRAIVEKYIHAWQEGQVLRSEDFRADPDPKVGALALEMVSQPDEYSPNWLEKRDLPFLSQRPPEENHGLDCMQAVLRFKEFKVQKRIAEVKAELEKFHAAGDHKQIILHLKILKELERFKKELATNGINTIGIRL